MKIFSKFAEATGRAWKKLKVSKNQKKNRQNWVRSCSELNVTEFEGRLYISYGNAPIVRVDMLKEDASKVLSQSRKDYLLWKEFYKPL